MNRSLGSFAQVSLELRERLLDRVEVGAVGREEEQCRAGGFDRLASGRRLVARQIVHDDDVAGQKVGDENLADIGDEGVAVDRPVEDHWGDHAGPTQAGDEGRRFPVPVRDARAQALAPPAAAMAAGHVRRGPGLIDEDQPLGVEVELPLEPFRATLHDVGAVLFGSVRGLFLRVIP